MDIFNSEAIGQELIQLFRTNDVKYRPRDLEDGFTREIDIVDVLNMSQGPELQYKPYEYSNWLNAAMSVVFNLTGACVPPFVGPLAQLSWLTVEALMSDPDQWREDNLLVWSPEMIDAAVDSASGMKLYWAGKKTNASPPSRTIMAID